jgi:hypothetical protein
MDIIQEACLLGLMVTSIFMGDTQPLVSFDWDEIGKHGPIFSPQYNREDAKILLQLSLMVSNSNLHNISLNTPSWLIDFPIKYDTCPVKLISDGELGSSGNLAHIFYSERANLLFIIFTGTYNACLMGVDMEHAQKEIPNLLTYTPGMKAHRGIYEAYQSIRPKLLKIVKHFVDTKNPQIVISGHSLGGALSQLSALDLSYYNPIHYSFASPQIFNPLAASVFDTFVKQSYRIANLSDLVVLSPLPVMPNKDSFCHVGKLIYFQRNLGEYLNNHTRVYIEEFDIPVTIIKT